MITLPFNMVSNTPVECTVDKNHQAYQNLTDHQVNAVGYHFFTTATTSFTSTFTFVPATLPPLLPAEILHHELHPRHHDILTIHPNTGALTTGCGWPDLHQVINGMDCVKVKGTKLMIKCQVLQGEQEDRGLLQAAGQGLLGQGRRGGHGKGEHKELA